MNYGHFRDVAALVAEGWNFSAKTVENRLLFESIVSRGTPDLIQKVLCAGASALELDKNGGRSLKSAASRSEVVLFDYQRG